MGMFSFVTTAGQKLGGAVYDALHKDEDLDKPATITPARLAELRQRNIERAIANAELDASSIQVAVKDDTVTLTGKLPTQADREKAVLIAGNQHGIAKVDCQIEIPEAAMAAEPESTLYAVVAGDTLSKIAKQFYGDASQYPRIFEANRPMLQDPDQIYIGQTLRIPAQQK